MKKWQRSDLRRRQPGQQPHWKARWKMGPDIYGVPAGREGDDVEMDKLSTQATCIQSIFSSEWLLWVS